MTGQFYPNLAGGVGGYKPIFIAQQRAVKAAAQQAKAVAKPAQFTEDSEEYYQVRTTVWTFLDYVAKNYKGFGPIDASIGRNMDNNEWVLKIEGDIGNHLQALRDLKIEVLASSQKRLLLKVAELEKAGFNGFRRGAANAI
ncbi:MAG: hypothetical protein LBQ83_04250 [Candidatus Margulisbacteria bacterium]|jgi:hypothetical protein|nr:hypothetical protein [Candidatus Margulisiibacteriota bacterium]